MMEDFFLNCREHKIIKKFKKRLESAFGVKIYIPDEKSAIDSDVIFGSIYGNNDSIQKVQKFLKKKLKKSQEKCETQKTNDVLLVTLSDSECSDDEELNETLHIPAISVESTFDTTKASYSSEAHQSVDSNFDTTNTTLSSPTDKSVESSFNTTNATYSSSRIDDSVCILESTCSSIGDTSLSNCDKNDTIIATDSSPIDDSICIIESTVSSGDEITVSDNVGSSLQKTSITGDSFNLNDSICIIETDVNCNVPQISSKPNSSGRSYKSLDDTFQSENDSICIIGSFPSRKRKRTQRDKTAQKTASPPFPNTNDSDVCEVSSTTEQPNAKRLKLSNGNVQKQKAKPAEEFIPLTSHKESADKTVILQEPETKKVPRRLRPIIIDGSNIAREHGRATTTFSSKGIQLCLNYFLERGHTEVTIFLPKFRRHSDKFKFCPLTDPAILEELEKKQYIVYTPSRNINGKVISCYDDRFMVQLAAKNGGVVVSNDNFKDLVAEKPSFKEVIEKRLLMYCFVGDNFMIPDDPLGRNGPKLSDFLSFPPDEEEKKE